MNILEKQSGSLITVLRLPISRKVLDKGFVELEEMLGGDAAVIRGARICYQSESSGAEVDARLINKLMRSEPKHNTPFEHAVFRFYAKCPKFVSIQWLRHRIGTFNEKSLRRTTPATDYYVPSSERYEYTDGELDAYEGAMQMALGTYEYLYEQGWPREVARGVINLSVYTEFIWTVNAWSLMNWLTKRLHKSAQWEHRQYAEAVLEIFEEAMPITADAFMRYLLGMK